jgi:transposase
MGRKRKRTGVLSVSKVKEVLRLAEMGLTQTEIARAAGAARSSVQDYIRRATASGMSYREVAELPESELYARLGKRTPGRRVTADGIQIELEEVERELSRKGVTLALLWMEYQTEGRVRVSYQTFCRHYRRWACRRKATLHIMHRPGEPVTDRRTGEVTEVPIFVAALGASYLKYCEATPDAALENWIGAHVRTLEYIGGVPEAIVPDNTKTGVTSPCLYDPELNKTYREFAEHCRVAVLPTRVRKPRDKAKVEKAVQDIERWVLAPLRDRTFYSVAELNAALWERLEWLNNRKLRERDMSAREFFELHEREALRPLPSYPYEFATWKSAQVAPDYHVQVEKHCYSVPYIYIGQQVEVRLGGQRLRVFHDNKEIASHQRSRVPFQYSTIPAHMPPNHIAIASQTISGLRAWARTVGPETVHQTEAIFLERLRPELGLRPVQGLRRLAAKHGAPALENACRRANERKLVGYRFVTRLLGEAPAESPAAELLLHDNLRGAAYFH